MHRSTRRAVVEFPVCPNLCIPRGLAVNMTQPGTKGFIAELLTENHTKPSRFKASSSLLRSQLCLRALSCRSDGWRRSCTFLPSSLSCELSRVCRRCSRGWGWCRGRPRRTDRRCSTARPGVEATARPHRDSLFVLHVCECGVWCGSTGRLRYRAHVNLLGQLQTCSSTAPPSVKIGELAWQTDGSLGLHHALLYVCCARKLMRRHAVDCARIAYLSISRSEARGDSEPELEAAFLK